MTTTARTETAYDAALRNWAKGRTETACPPLDEAQRRHREMLLRAAEKYESLGYTVFPIDAGKKRALTNYDRCFEGDGLTAQEWADLADEERFGGLAFVCGAPIPDETDGYTLAVLDLDRDEPAQRFFADKDLSRCRITRTRQGWHVLFLARMADLPKDEDGETKCTVRLVDGAGMPAGELRVRHLATAPPTLYLNTDANRLDAYAFTDKELPHVRDLERVADVAGFLGAELGRALDRATVASELASMTAGEDVFAVPRADSDLAEFSCFNIDHLDEIVSRTVPESKGMRVRHWRIFCCWRMLMAFGDFDQWNAAIDADSRLLSDFADLWWRRALPTISTKDFDETHDDFFAARKAAKYAWGAGPFGVLCEEGMAGQNPDCFPSLLRRASLSEYDLTLLRILHRVQVYHLNLYLRQRERSGKTKAGKGKPSRTILRPTDGSLYIVQERFSDEIGITQQAVSKKLNRWAAQGILAVTAPSIPKVRAARYRLNCGCFLWDLEE